MAGKSFIQRLKRVKNSLFFRGSILAFMNDSFFFSSSSSSFLSLLYFTFFFPYYLFFPSPSVLENSTSKRRRQSSSREKKEGGLIRWFQALVNNLLKVKSSCLVAFRDPLFFFVYSKNLRIVSFLTYRIETTKRS